LLLCDIFSGFLTISLVDQFINNNSFIMPTLNFLGIIPARYASTRFPGKPLTDIGGKSMIQRVYEQASKAMDSVVVATDDERIMSAVLAFGGKAEMTLPTHRSGTDRCMETVDLIAKKEGENFDVVINIQGDEPFIDPNQLKLLMGCFDTDTTQIATLIKKISQTEDIFNPNLPKVIYNKNKEAIYFSRSPIPYIRNEKEQDWLCAFPFYKHIGIYAYRTNVLREITKIRPSSLELAESLEQNRWIENGYRVKIEITDFETVAVDTPDDLERIKKMGLI
jgi:3-deoxy-manno-octulosonate cytidylyltransferase (CMP-KDO synthetase)